MGVGGGGGQRKGIKVLSFQLHLLLSGTYSHVLLLDVLNHFRCQGQYPNGGVQCSFE